ncbi:hypothetical protein AVEN_27345-1 [Araneus ventricosus]|uniref:Uncharacterized protein n=1 Tax=Araneus ventricosus TaxID=182803 RepID=A0A4Y2R2R5_ARAVE|nr:hypothetical protein AVEN_248878-1 [Araneus ventricosus]GBN69982.1 hypothetical protein AVEN_27345-1 [Araneus ventricosus]
MAAGVVRIVRKLFSSPNTSERATLMKKARAVGVKSITFNERGWRFQSGIRTFRMAIVFCLKGRMGHSSIDRVKCDFVVTRLLLVWCSAPAQVPSSSSDVIPCPRA